MALYASHPLSVDFPLVTQTEPLIMDKPERWPRVCLCQQWLRPGPGPGHPDTAPAAGHNLRCDSEPRPALRVQVPLCPASVLRVSGGTVPVTGSEGNCQPDDTR